MVARAKRDGKPFTPAFKRSCGSCKACCTTMGVKEIGKPPGEPCKHLCAVGCGVYLGRPQSCRVFGCGWLHGYGPLDGRPDLCNVLFWVQVTDDGVLEYAVAEELEEGAADKGLAYAMARTLSQHHAVAIRDPSRRVRSILGPRAAVEALVAKARAHLGGAGDDFIAIGPMGV